MEKFKVLQKFRDDTIIIRKLKSIRHLKFFSAQLGFQDTRTFICSQSWTKIGTLETHPRMPGRFRVYREPDTIMKPG